MVERKGEEMPQIRNIDITPGGSTQVLHVSQNDVGREITVNVKDGAGYFELDNCTVTVAGTKPSGLGYSVECTVSGHQVVITTTKGMTDEHGSIASELKIASGGNVIGSANFILAVERDPHPENTTDGSADSLVPAITLLVERVEAAVAKEEVLHEAEAWAVGQRAGEDVGEDDPTYHNNSKYYAGKAEASKIAAQSSEQNASAQALAASGSASAASASKTASEAAAARSEAASEAAGNVFAQVGNVTYSVMPDGGVREVWTKEE